MKVSEFVRVRNYILSIDSYKNPLEIKKIVLQEIGLSISINEAEYLAKEYLESVLTVGVKISIGKKYAEENSCKEGEIIELVEGYFEYDNGLYTEDQTAPSIWNEKTKDFDSIYHLFGNDLEYFMDCEIINNEEN